MSRPTGGFSGWTHPSSPYDVLGVSRFASNAEIRRAYRKRALETHPDKQFQFGATEEEGLAAEALFREVLEAFELLNDPYKRRVYDIHSRPPPTPNSHRRTFTETSVPSATNAERKDTVDETGHHTTRAQDRSEWTRQEEAAHRAWRAERIKSYSATSIPIKTTQPKPNATPSTADTHLPSKSPPNTTTPKPTPPNLKATSPQPTSPKATSPRPISPKASFSKPTSPQSTSPTAIPPIRSFPNTPRSPPSSNTPYKPFSNIPFSNKAPSSSDKPQNLTPSTPSSSHTSDTRCRSDTTSTTYSNTSSTNSTRSRSSTADSTCTNTTTTESVKSKSSTASASIASQPKTGDVLTDRKASTDTASTKEQTEANAQSVLGYEEWVERILAELYLMSPDWMNIDKNGPRRMDASPV